MYTEQYYIRIGSKDNDNFVEYTINNGIEFTILSYDMANGEPTTLYSVKMDEQAALGLKLTIPTWGFLNFTKVLRKPLGRE